VLGKGNHLTFKVVVLLVHLPANTSQKSATETNIQKNAHTYTEQRQ